MKVLGLIPARGGSKGIARKNIKPLGGKPLLAYTAETALAAKRLSCVILSTEDAEIAEIGRQCNLEVPFLRPPELARDETPTLPVVRHALESLAAENFDAVCLLQPTNPLRRAIDIDNCLELLETTGATAIVSVLPVPLKYHPRWVYWRDNEGRIVLSTGEAAPIARRQDLPPAFHRDGSVYAIRAETVLHGDSLYGKDVRSYLMDSNYSANIDTEEDWLEVERRMNFSAATNGKN